MASGAIDQTQGDELVGLVFGDLEVRWRQLDARLLDILQPPPVVVEEVDEPATETRLEPVSSQVPAREAAVRLPVTTESTADEIEVVEEVEYLAPIVAPRQSLKKRK